MQKKNFLTQIFKILILIINLPWGYLRSPQNLGPIGSAVLTFIFTNRQKDIQASKVYI